MNVDNGELIECVRGYEYLYNNKCQDYKYLSLKNEAWEQIGAELNASAADCKAKWNRLRNAFVHALARRKAVEGVKNFKKWKYEDELSFLLPFLLNRNIVREPEVIVFSNENENTNDSTEYIEEFLDDDEISSTPITPITPPKKRKFDNYHEDMIKIMKSNNRRCSKTSETTDIDLFFNSIAETVKKLPKLEQAKLKMGIMKMVNEVEIKCLESDSSDV